MKLLNNRALPFVLIAMAGLLVHPVGADGRGGGGGDAPLVQKQANISAQGSRLAIDVEAVDDSGRPHGGRRDLPQL